jgi:hypothetical protein
MFQLQRRAFQARGEGTWERIEDEIPTGGTDLLNELPLEPQPMVCNCGARHIEDIELPTSVRTKRSPTITRRHSLLK